MIYSFSTIIKYSYRFLWWLSNYWRFKRLGFFSYINNSLKINGAQNIEIGRKVLIQYKTWLAAMPLTGNHKPILMIGDGTVIGNFNHIYATNRIIIGTKVLTADKVYISDNLHGFEDVSKPIISQPLKQVCDVVIGDGAWLGENVCIIGASVGKNSVIGANSVVTKNIPDFCVAVGAPAKIIKRYNIKTKTWDNTYPDGTFIKYII